MTRTFICLSQYSHTSDQIWEHNSFYTFYYHLVDLVQKLIYSNNHLFEHAKLIGLNNDNQSLDQYSNSIFVKFIEEQLIYFPNSRSLIDSWITISGELFDNVIKKNTIPITDMPSVQFTTLMQSNDEKCKKYLHEMKTEILKSALKELDEAKTRCNIPSLQSFLNAKKHHPLEWNALSSFRKSFIQPIESYNEQKKAIELCINSIDEYANIHRRNYVKSCTIRGFAGCGKSWCMQYCLLHCYSKGLLGIPTSVMSRRSVFLGSKHIDHLFGLPFSKLNLSPYQIAENAISKLYRYPEKINLLRAMDILFIDEIGQLPAETLSTIEIILRRIRNHSNVFMGGIIIISTLDHTQLKPVNGRPFFTFKPCHHKF